MDNRFYDHRKGFEERSGRPIIALASCRRQSHYRRAGGSGPNVKAQPREDQ